MAIILISILWTAAIVGGSIGLAILVSNGIDKIIGSRAEDWYKKIEEKL